MAKNLCGSVRFCLWFWARRRLWGLYAGVRRRLWAVQGEVDDAHVGWPQKVRTDRESAGRPKTGRPGVSGLNGH